MNKSSASIEDTRSHAFASFQRILFFGLTYLGISTLIRQQKQHIGGGGSCNEISSHICTSVDQLVFAA